MELGCDLEEKYPLTFHFDVKLKVEIKMPPDIGLPDLHPFPDEYSMDTRKWYYFLVCLSCLAEAEELPCWTSLESFETIFSRSLIRFSFESYIFLISSSLSFHFWRFRLQFSALRFLMISFFSFFERLIQPTGSLEFCDMFWGCNLPMDEELKNFEEFPF